MLQHTLQNGTARTVTEGSRRPCTWSLHLCRGPAHGHYICAEVDDILLLHRGRFVGVWMVCWMRSRRVPSSTEHVLACGGVECVGQDALHILSQILPALQLVVASVHRCTGRARK